jgi:hypothetical protein
MQPHSYRTGPVECVLCKDLNLPIKPFDQDSLAAMMGEPSPEPSHETEIIFTPDCHPEHGAHAVYCSIHGALTIVCNACGSASHPFQIAIDGTTEALIASTRDGLFKGWKVTLTNPEVATK